MLRTLPRTVLRGLGRALTALACSPILFWTATLLLPLAGLVLFRSPWGLLLGLAAPAAALLGTWRLARRLPVWREALVEQLTREIRADQGVEEDDGPCFLRDDDRGEIRAFPRRDFPAEVEVTALLPRPESAIIARRSGTLTPPATDRPPEPPTFDTRRGDATEVFYAGVSHVETSDGQVRLHTVGGQEVDFPDVAGPAGRVADYLRACVRNRQSLGADARPTLPEPSADPADGSTGGSADEKAASDPKGCHESDAHVLTLDDPFAVD